MQWYVRTECGDVRGPMDQADAEFERDRLDDACLFSERIFEPRFVTTSEVELLLKDLRDLRGYAEDRPHRKETDEAVAKLCQRAIDAITFLSRVPTAQEVAGVLTDLRDLQTIRGGSVICQEGIDLIVNLSRENVIEASLRGGVFDVESDLPVGVTLKVRDYDAEGYDADRVVEDEDGDSCVEIEFANRE